MKRGIARCALLGSVVAVLCAAPARADRWYEDYDAAVAMIEGGACSSVAIQLLGAAVVDRPQPKRSLRTYAVRTIDYLPYLQLAKAYQACGAEELARHYLELAAHQGVASGKELAAVRATLPAVSETPVAVADSGEQLRHELVQCLDGLQELQQVRQRLAEQLQERIALLEEARHAGRAAAMALLDGNSTVLFEPNQVIVGPLELAEQQLAVLARLAGLLTLADDIRLRIDGHTDATGDAESNQRISEQRAESVRQLLFSFGVDPARLDTAGHGSSQPQADNSTEHGRRRNRRVEISLAP